MRIVNRRNEYARWQDFPVPDVVTNLNQAVVAQDFTTLSNSNGIPALSNYTSFQVKTTYNRDQYAGNNSAFLGLKVQTSWSDSRLYSPKDLAGICITVGRVTKDMLRVHAQDYWQVETRKKKDSSYVPPVTDYQGTAAYLMGITFYQRLNIPKQKTSRLKTAASSAWTMPKATNGGQTRRSLISRAEYSL